MLTVRFAEVGDPSVLRLEEVPPPRPPGRDELLVRVLASSVNGTDLGLRRGDLRVATWGRLPFTPGFDLAGEVLRCGPAVTAFSPGDRVVALLGHGGGALAEQVLLRQGRAALAPRTLAPEHAAALPLAGLTALQALHGAAALHARPRPARVLVLGASGGIGSYAVQLAVLAGARVTGTARGAKLAFVRGLGAQQVLDHATRDVAALDERYDVVLDAPGLHRFRRLRHLLRPGGVLVSTRPLTPDLLRSAPGSRTAGPRFAPVMARARSQDLARLVALADSGRLHPPVDRVVPLERAAEAHQHASGAAVGKVVISLPGAPP